MCRKANPVWILVFLHPWLSCGGATASHSAHSCTQRHLTQGEQHVSHSSPYHLVHMTLSSSVFSLPWLCVSGSCVRAPGSVSHPGRLSSVPGRSWRYCVSSHILHSFLLPPGHEYQRTAPCSQSGPAGRNCTTDTRTGHKGEKNISWYIWSYFSLYSTLQTGYWKAITANLNGVRLSSDLCNFFFSSVPGLSSC